MSILIVLPTEAERRLDERARAAGIDVPAYAQRLLLSVLDRPQSLVEISGPLRKQFLESGMTDDELGDVLEEAKHAMRQDRRKRQSP